ncbi:uncharacterized protein LOC141599428 [Silene latifolia]|uniref:uncharacterized protein LOC141599428 n=1 Tax=Silene latifolia TaxID=37657 RepID=UPI003D77B88C
MASTFKHFFSLLSIFFLIPLTLSAAIETSNTDYDITHKNNNGLGEEEKTFEVFKSKLKFVYGHNNHEPNPKKGHVAYAYDQLDQGQFENDDKKLLQKSDGKSDEVACDSYNSCPSNATCCCTYTYGPYCLSWGCCPLEKGVCCANDPSQCCPRHRPICDVRKSTCKKKKNSQFSSKALKLSPV